MLVSSVQQSDSYIYVCVFIYIYKHIYILFRILFHYRLLQNIEYSSLCYKVSPCYLIYVKVTQSCLTLCDPMYYTVYGILQARILE